MHTQLSYCVCKVFFMKVEGIFKLRFILAYHTTWQMIVSNKSFIVTVMFWGFLSIQSPSFLNIRQCSHQQHHFTLQIRLQFPTPSRHWYFYIIARKELSNSPFNDSIHVSSCSLPCHVRGSGVYLYVMTILGWAVDILFSETQRSWFLEARYTNAILIS